ncbi:MAG: metallophosphoesterase [Kofleriaceae bacterium]
MRLAHCSDLHLLALDGARWLDFASKRWIGKANLLTNRSRHYLTEAFDDLVDDVSAEATGIDHLLCTGDVTNVALPQEYAFARGRFDRLALGPDAVTVLPGNHDVYVLEGGHHFTETFGAYGESDPGWTWPVDDTPRGHTVDGRRAEFDARVAARFPLVRVRGELALIGLTSSLATPWFTAYGRLGELQLERLRAVLADPRLAGKARVVALHHPPAGRWAKSAIRGLKDHEAFARVIAEVGADLIVHGHEHRDLHHELAGPTGPVPVLGVPSGTYAGKDARRTASYRVIEIEGGRVVSHHLRRWDRAERRFAAQLGELASPSQPAMA